jgi:hypothetical protein
MCNLSWRGNRRNISFHGRNLNTVTESGHAPYIVTRTSLHPFIYLLSHSVCVTDEAQNCIKSIFILKTKYIAGSQWRHKEEANAQPKSMLHRQLLGNITSFIGLVDDIFQVHSAQQKPSA